MNERIRQRMNKLNLKSVDLVNATKANKGTVSTWVNGLNEPKGDYLFSLARALQVTPEWLLTGKGHPDDIHDNVEAAPRLKGLVPVINEVQAGHWTEIKTGFDEEASEWIPTLHSNSRYAFALRVVGDSMLNPHEKRSLSKIAAALLKLATLEMI